MLSEIAITSLVVLVMGNRPTPQTISVYQRQQQTNCTVLASSFGDNGGMGSVPDTARTVVISVNPNSGSGSRRDLVDRLVHLLKQQGFEVVIPGTLETLFTDVRQLFAEGQLRAVVAAGGDGTAALLVNELPKNVPLCMLPLGTENLLAKYLEIAANPEDVCDLICEGNFVDLDVGKANDRFFIIMCGCGFDADVVERLHSKRQGHINHWSYARPIIDAISRYRYPTLRIRVDGQADEIRSKWAFIFNVPRYAMNLPIVEDADCFDGLLDLCTFRGGNLVRGLAYLVGIVLRQHRRWDDTTLAKFKKLTIESDEPVPFQLDGDPGGHLPLTIEVIPGYLRVIVSQKWLQRIGMVGKQVLPARNP